jgi:adenylylsulfate kinase
VFKAISWRFLATLTTTLVVYLITGSTEFAVTVGLIEGAAKIGLYYAHERVWNRLDVGRRPGGHRADAATGPPLMSPRQEHE